MAIGFHRHTRKRRLPKPTRPKLGVTINTKERTFDQACREFWAKRGVDPKGFEESFYFGGAPAQ